MNARTIVVTIAVLLLGSGTAMAQAGSLDPTFNPGDVGYGFGDGASILRCTAMLPDGKVLVGGSFSTYDGMPYSGIARLNPNGGLDSSFPATDLNGEVFRMALQPDGKTIIVGGFTTYNGTVRNGVARLNADGGLDTYFAAGAGAEYQPWQPASVLAMVIQPDGKVLLGGHFITYDGMPRSRIARVNPDGSLDASFDPGGGADGTIRSIALQPDGNILVCGDFTNYDGITRDHLARLHADGSLDASFDPGGGPSVTIPGTSLKVNVISALPDGKVLIAGQFDSYPGTNNLTGLARLQADGSLDPGFVFHADAYPDIMTLASYTDGKILVGGRFFMYNNDTGNTGRNIARLNANGSLDLSFECGSGSDSYVEEVITQPDNKILIAGWFTMYNGIGRKSIARLNAEGGLDTPFDPPGTGVTGSGYNTGVHAFAMQPDGRILIAGWFTTYNGTPRNHIARLNTDGTLDPTFDPGTGFEGGELNVRTDAIAVQSNGQVLVSGTFSSYDGTTRSSIVRLNTDGTLDASFDTGTAIETPVPAIVSQPDGKILAGHMYWQNTDWGLRIVRVGVNGGVSNSSFLLGPGTHHLTMAAQPDGKIVIGGDFTEYDGVPRNRIARLNADGSLDTTFNPGAGANGIVRSVAVQPDGNILIAGDFTSYDATARNRVARLRADGPIDLSFDPGSGVSSDFMFTSPYIQSVAVLADGKILIGGYFVSCNGNPSRGIARLDADGSLDLSFETGTGVVPESELPEFSSYVHAIALQPDGRILIGGAFTSYNGIGRNRIARLMGDEVFDCEGVLGGPALPGTPCDDGCALNGSEVWDPQCVCTGQALTGMVELTPFDTLCPGGDPYPLAHAVPAGGTWSGMNVADNAFQAGPQLGGDAELSYTVTDPNTGCTLTATQPIAWMAPQVSSVDGPLISGPFGGGCGYDPLQLVAVPAGGTWAYPADDGGVLDRSCEARPFTIDESVYTLHAANGDCPAVHLAFVENWIEYRPCAEPIDAGPDISVCTDGGQLEWTGFYYHNPGSPYSSQDTHTDCDSSYWEADTHHCLFFPEQHEAGIYPIVRISVNTAYCGIAYDTLIVTIAEPSLWYLDADGDGLGDANDTVTACGQPEGHVAISTDCDDADASITAPGDPCDDGNANTGNDVLTEGCVCLGTPVDSDGDGVPDDTDCAPNDPNVQVLNAGSNGTCEVCAANAAYDLFGCLGGSPQPGGTWYTLPGDTVVSASFDASAYGPGVWQFWYVLDATANCPADSAVAIVMVTAAPDAGEDASVAVCSDGIPIDLFSVLNGTPDAGGAWSLNGTAHSNFYNPTSDAPGAYTYVSTGTSPCANDTATVTVAEPQAPDPGISGVVTLCSNGVAVELLDFVNGGPDSTGTWSFNGTAHSGIFVPGTDAPGVYWYSVEGVEPCFDNSASMLVTVVLAPNSGEDSSILICGTDAPFSLFGALPDNPDVGGTWFLDGQMTGPFFDPGTYEEGTYTCLYVVSGNVPCPGDTATLTVTLMEADIIPITIIGPDPVLTQDPVTYTADPALDSVVWTLPDGWAWSPDDTDTTDATAILIPSTQGGPFTISAQGFGSGCESGTYTFAGNSSVGMAAGNSPADGMLVYPNPTQGHLTVRWGTAGTLRFALINALGQQVLNLGQHASGAVLDLGGIAPGVYTLRWKGTEKEGRTSVLVQ